MMGIFEFTVIILVHWIADFICQDEEWANNKSKAMKPLLLHTTTYSLIWALAFFLISQSLLDSVLFGAITFVAHTITDYFTSRIVSKKFTNKHYGSAIPNFGAFTVIGFDQVLHYIQLILTRNLFL